MNGNNAEERQNTDPFFRNILNQAKEFHTRDVLPEEYRALMIRVDRRMASTCREMVERLRPEKFE